LSRGGHVAVAAIDARVPLEKVKIVDRRGSIASRDNYPTTPEFNGDDVATRTEPARRVRSARRLEAYWPFVNARLHRTAVAERRDAAGEG